MTLPVQNPGSLTPSLGWSSIRGTSLIHSENWYTVLELLYFNGVQGIETGIPFTITRAIYSFAAALLGPFVGIFPAFLLLNWIAWGMGVWATWRLSLRLTRNPQAAFWASALACGGFGFILHIHDYGAHLLSFTSYYLGTYFLYTSGLFLRRRPWRTHLLLATYLAGSVLIYNTGIMLLAAYGILAWRKNRFRHIAAVVGIVLVTRPLWIHYLQVMGVPFQEVEGKFLGTGLTRWVDMLSGPKWVTGFATLFSEFLTFEFPLTIALGLLGCVLSPWRPTTRWFGAIIMTIPIFAGLAFAPAMSARGYVVYGISIWVYCGMGYMLAACPRRRLPMVCVGVILAGHFLWSSAHLWRQLGPAQTYFRGWFAGSTPFFHRPTLAYSMTGNETVPILYGGQASIEEAGGVRPALRADGPLFRYSVKLAILRRAPLAILLAWIFWIWLPNRRWRIWGTGTLLGLTFGSALLAIYGRIETPLRFPVSRNIRLSPGTAAQYRIQLAPSFLDALEKASGPNNTLAIQIPYLDDPPDVALSAGSLMPLDLDKKCRWGSHVVCLKDPASVLASFRKSGELRITFKNKSPQNLDLLGWQRMDLAGRVWSASRDVTAPGAYFGHPTPLPAFEIRLYREDGSLNVLGF